MRLLFLSTWHPYPSDNGSKIRAKYLLRALASQHDVTALAFRPPESQLQKTDKAKNEEVPIIEVPADPFQLRSASAWRRYMSPSPLSFRPSSHMRDAVTGLAGGSSWDAVVAIQMPVAQYALQVQSSARVIDVDTALTFQMRERYQAQSQPITRASTWVSWQKAHRYERRMLRRFQAALVASSLEIDPLRQVIGSAGCEVALVANGVDCDYNRPGLAIARPNSLVYNGSLTYSANYDAVQWFLAEVYPRLKAQVPDVTLAVTGSTEGVDLAGLALDDTVRLTDYVDDVRIPVSQAAVCIVPIRQGGGTRLKILEAMALGTPVVATSKGAEGLDVVDGEHLLLADAPEMFAVRTAELLSNPDLRHRLAANARRLVEAHYDWQAIGQHFVDLVEETVAAHRRK